MAISLKHVFLELLFTGRSCHKHRFFFFFAIVLVYLFFNSYKIVPKLMISFYILNIIYVITDHTLVSNIPAVANALESNPFKTFGPAAIGSS